MKANKENLIFVLSIMVSFYLGFDIIFFSILGHVESDILIGISLFFLFFLIYKKSREFFYSYMWSLSKNLYLNFFSLFYLLISLRKLVLGFSSVYLQYFKYNFYVLNMISNIMSDVFNMLSLNLMNNYFTNYYLNLLKLKVYLIQSNTNYLSIEYIIKNNSIYELNMMLAFDTMIFIYK